MTQAPPLQSLIGSRILTLRAQRVMLDADLAELYDVPTKALGAGGQAQSGALSARFHVPAVGRGVRCFEVTNCDLKRRTRRTAHGPYAFTEQGVAMLSSVLFEVLSELMTPADSPKRPIGFVVPPEPQKPGKR